MLHVAVVHIACRLPYEKKLNKNSDVIHLLKAWLNLLIKTSDLTQLKTKYKTNNNSTPKNVIYSKYSTNKQSFLTNDQSNKFQFIF